MAETKSTKKDQPMLDPIAYRSNYPEENIIGTTPATKEVTEKYIGEGTNNVYHPYNKNLTIDQLDPNYQYGQPAKDINAIDDSYITRRNDMIASALYNEGKVGYNDVVSFLQGQRNWYNSTEEDRATTTANVWNRLGQISAGNPKEENKEVDTSRMESDLNKDTSGVIYGKTTADSGNPEKGIQTSEDVNSPFRIADEARIANVKTLLGLSTQQIAAALYSNTIPSDMQAMVDYQSYYPELWAEVQQYLKQYQGQDVVNAIASGTDIPTNTNGTSAANNNIADFAASNSGYSNSMQDILKDIHQTLESNQSATSASETMADIEEEIAVLNKRLKNLTKEANTVFKGDAPDYLVKAYVNNKTQEIQNQLSILSERYKYASNRYDKEVANAQNDRKLDLEERQVAVQEGQLALNIWKEKNGVSTTTTTTVNTNPTKSTSLSGKELPMTTHTRSEISSYVDNLVDMLNKGQLGNSQCASGIQTYYLPQLGISFGTLSKWYEKLGIRNEDSSYTPQKGDLIILASGTAPANGHMGIVTGITADGKIEYLDWNGLNGKNAEEPALRTIDPSSAKIQGYYNATKGFSSGIDEETRAWYDQNYGAGYDPDLGYNPSITDVYEKLSSGDWSGTYPEHEAELRGISVKELGRQSSNYAEAKNKGLVKFTYPNRNVGEFGYIEGREDIYRGIIKTLSNGKQIPGTQKNTYIEQLGLNVKDSNAWNTIMDEVSAYEKADDSKFEAVKDLIQATEFIMSQDANRTQRLNSWATWVNGEGSDWNTAYNLIKANQALDALADSKGKGATLTPMSDKDFQAIKEASSLIKKTDSTPTFKTNVENYYNTLRDVAGLPQLTRNQLDEMWNTESSKKAKWDNYLVLEGIRSGDSWYRYYNGNKVWKGSYGYDAGMPTFLKSSNTSTSGVDDEIDDVFNSIQ